MAFDPRAPYGSAVGANGRSAARSTAVDQGLRAFMLAVYNHMAIGVALTGFVALGVFMASVQQVDGQIVGLTGLGVALFQSPLKFVVMLAPLAIVLWMSFGAAGMTASKARTLFYVYAGLMGLSLSTILLVYTGQSVARVFFVSAASFGALSLYGYTTKKDLSGMGAFLMMGLFGLIIGSVVNLFLASSGFQFVLTIAGVLIFAGLTAYDTQMLKSTYWQGQSREDGDKLAVYGALNLYMDFLNLFLSLLRLLGDRR